MRQHLFAFCFLSAPLFGFVDIEINCDFSIYPHLAREKMLTHRSERTGGLMPNMDNGEVNW